MAWALLYYLIHFFIIILKTTLFYFHKRDISQRLVKTGQYHRDLPAKNRGHENKHKKIEVKSATSKIV